MAARREAADSADGSGSAEHEREAAGNGRGAARDERHPGRPDGRDRRGRSRPAAGRRLTAVSAARAGLQQIAEVTGRQVDGVTAVEPSDDGWVVGVEVVEDQRIPSSTDVLAIYQADLDQRGELVSYRRIKRYKRGQGDSDYGGESW